MCSHAVALDDMLVVSDTLADERFRNFPYVCGEPGVRFYAGQPLHSLDGQPVGTLCILDTRRANSAWPSGACCATWRRWCRTN
jgi:GAF domain-containing protein